MIQRIWYWNKAKTRGLSFSLILPKLDIKWPQLQISFVRKDS